MGSEFIDFSDQLTRLEKSNLSLLKPEFDQVVSQLLAGMKIELGFSTGWDKKRQLDEVLASSFERDLRQGFTGSGPQRADLRLKVDGHNAAERLSVDKRNYSSVPLSLRKRTVSADEQPPMYLSNR